VTDECHRITQYAHAETHEDTSKEATRAKKAYLEEQTTRHVAEEKVQELEFEINELGLQCVYNGRKVQQQEVTIGYIIKRHERLKVSYDSLVKNSRNQTDTINRSEGDFQFPAQYHLSPYKAA
jgi:hypothetical protein